MNYYHRKMPTYNTPYIYMMFHIASNTFSFVCIKISTYTSLRAFSRPRYKFIKRSSTRRSTFQPGAYRSRKTLFTFGRGRYGRSIFRASRRRARRRFLVDCRNSSGGRSRRALRFRVASGARSRTSGSQCAALLGHSPFFLHRSRFVTRRFRAPYFRIFLRKFIGR